MDQLDAMRTFVAVARAGSFAEAARRLRLSASAVTRSIAHLEDELGATVLVRTTRSVRVTDRGRRYLERCEQILEDVRAAERVVRGEDAELRGALVVAAPVVFGRLHVLPIVNRLLASHRGLAIRLALSDRNAHLVAEGVDVAVRVGELADSAALAVKLAAVQRTVVASPAYLAARGTPRTPAELADHDIVACETIDATDEWRFRSTESVRVSPRLVVNSADAAIAAAEAGIGVTRAMSYQVRGAVAAGRLAVLLRSHAPATVAVSAMYPTRRSGVGGVAAFVAAARDYFQATPLDAG